jgi:DegV family protein with EDD domain
MTIGLCTDSSSQLPPDLAARYGIEVVPVTVRIGDEEYLEGVDLDADRFYELYRDGERPVVTTTQPSSGQYAVAFDDLLARGCTEIVSIHVASTVSGSMNAARLAAHQMGVPVRLVDSGTTGFAVACATWAAADAVVAGADIDTVVAAAEGVGPSVGNVFVVGALDLLREGAAATSCAVPVLGLRDGQVQVIDRSTDVDHTVASMHGYLEAWQATAGARLRVAIGVADARVAPLGAALAATIGSSPHVDDVVGFRLGPSAGSHTGPGTVSCFMFPTAT